MVIGKSFKNYTEELYGKNKLYDRIDNDIWNKIWDQVWDNVEFYVWKKVDTLLWIRVIDYSYKINVI